MPPVNVNPVQLIPVPAQAAPVIATKARRTTPATMFTAIAKNVGLAGNLINLTFVEAASGHGITVSGNAITFRYASSANASVVQGYFNGSAAAQALIDLTNTGGTISSAEVGTHYLAGGADATLSPVGGALMHGRNFYLATSAVEATDTTGWSKFVPADVAVIEADYTASAGEVIMLHPDVETALTITLPENPSIGDIVTVLNPHGNFDTVAPYLNPEPEGIHLSGSDYTQQIATNDYAEVKAIYTGTTVGWKLTYHGALSAS